MKARTRMTGVLAVAAAATAFGLTLPHLIIAGGAASSTQHDAEVAAVNEVQEEQKRQPIRFVAERGTLSDFLNSRIVELAEGIWLVGREPDVAVVIAHDDKLRAFSTDVEAADPTAVARIEHGTPQEFMDVLHRFASGASELAGGDSCADCTNPGPPGVFCCMSNCEEHTANWCVCMSEAQCADNGGVCELEVEPDPSQVDAVICRYTCCDAEE